jgi:hypothetical protein
VLSVVVMLVLLANSDYIINVMVMLMNDIVLMNDIMLVMNYVAVLNHPAVITAIIIFSFAVTSAPATIISFAIHLFFLAFLNFLFASTAFANLRFYRICEGDLNCAYIISKSTIPKATFVPVHFTLTLSPST